MFRIHALFVEGKTEACLYVPSSFAVDEEDVQQRLERIPVDIWGRLFPFQRQGIRRGVAVGGRTLLADEMGLGKTVQVRPSPCCQSRCKFKRGTQEHAQAAAARCSSARTTISLGYTLVCVSVPRNISSAAMRRFCASKKSTTNTSYALAR